MSVPESPGKLQHRIRKPPLGCHNIGFGNVGDYNVGFRNAGDLANTGNNNIGFVARQQQHRPPGCPATTQQGFNMLAAGTRAPAAACSIRAPITLASSTRAPETSASQTRAGNWGIGNPGTDNASIAMLAAALGILNASIGGLTTRAANSGFNVGNLTNASTWVTPIPAAG